MDRVRLLVIISEARELLRRGHCQGSFAQRRNGPRIPLAYATRHSCFCAEGALRFASNVGVDAPCPAVDEFITLMGLGGIVSLRTWNDSNRHADVLRGFDTAVRKLQRELSQ